MSQICRFKGKYYIPVQDIAIIMRNSFVNMCYNNNNNNMTLFNPVRGVYFRFWQKWRRIASLGKENVTMLLQDKTLHVFYLIAKFVTLVNLTTKV